MELNKNHGINQEMFRDKINIVVLSSSRIFWV